jgi:hypothetical protein
MESLNVVKNTVGIGIMLSSWVKRIKEEVEK